MTGSPERKALQERARLAKERGEPLAWFEEIYAGDQLPPWADLAPHPSLLAWLPAGAAPESGRALVVGCGLGDDAEALAERGFNVAAFDVSSSAIESCGQRWPNSRVDYREMDAREPPAEWLGAFELVVEIYTLQAIPTELRSPVLAGICSCLAPGGTLFLLCRGRDASEPQGEGPPWALSREDLEAMIPPGIRIASLSDFLDREDPPVRRLRLALVAPAEET